MTSPRWDSPALRPFRLLYAVWLLGIVAYFVPGPTWNPVSRFSLTRAVLERGTLSIDATADASGDRARASGHWYTDKAPVPSFLALPVYALSHAVSRLRGTDIRYRTSSRGDTPAVRVYVNRDFRQALYLCSLGTAGLLAVWMTLSLFDLLRRRYSVGAALFGSMSALLATPLLPYATSFYGHAVAAALLVFGFSAVDGLDDSSDARAPAPGRVVLCGLCWALAAGSEYITAALVAALSLWLIGRTAVADRLRVTGALAAGAALPVALVSLYHWRCFGAPWRTGYAFVTRPQFIAGHAQGVMGIRLPTAQSLAGLFVGESRGLFYLSPLCLAAFGLLLWAAWRRVPGARLGSVLIVLLGLLNAGYYMWWGGASAGPRHLVPALPFLAIGLAWGFHHLRLARIPLLLISLVSAGNMFALTFVGLEAPEFVDVLADYVWPRLWSPDGGASHRNTNLGILAGLSRGVSTAPLLVWFAAGLRALLLQRPSVAAPGTHTGRANAGGPDVGEGATA